MNVKIEKNSASLLHRNVLSVVPKYAYFRVKSPKCGPALCCGAEGSHHAIPLKQLGLLILSE